MLNFDAVQQAGMARMMAKMQADQGNEEIEVPTHASVIHPLVHQLTCENNGTENILLTPNEAARLGMTLHQMALALDMHEAKASEHQLALGAALEGTEVACRHYTHRAPQAALDLGRRRHCRLAHRPDRAHHRLLRMIVAGFKARLLSRIAT